MNGGNAWSRLSWVLGFRKLGYDVCFIEQIDKQNCTGAALNYFRSTMKQFGLQQDSALLGCDGSEMFGLPLSELVTRAKEAILFNLSGHLQLADITSAVRFRIYYDDDPGFTQFWHAAGMSVAGIGHHDAYFTLGGNIGNPECPIPVNGIRWKHTRPPVVLDAWPVAPGAFNRFTTVASWRGAYGPVQVGSKTYGVKAHEFRKFIEIPVCSAHRFEVALQIHPADQKDLDRLLANRWKIADPLAVAGTADEFRQYVQQSGAEFSVAQNVYVDTNSGWFSDRTVRYLASGKPALVQDTGFTGIYPTDEGLVAFRTVGEAVEGAERIVRDYNSHCKAARRIAEEFFDSGKVLRRLILDAGLEPAS
jgi:hypothetical protein